MNNQCTDGITKLVGREIKKVTFKCLLELHLENKKYKMTKRENKIRKIFAIIPL